MYVKCEDGMMASSDRTRPSEKGMMYMMDWLKWKVIELLIEHRVLAVVPVRAQGRGRKYR